MQNDTFAPRHIENNVVKRAWNWITGKTGSENSIGKTPSVSNPPSFAPDLSLTATGVDKKSIAILPFKNLSHDKDSNFYEFSLADAVITELARLKSLVVRPSSVITKYQGKDVDSREAGRELQVNAVLSAGFLRAGERLRVTAQLLDVLSGEILWSDRIDAEGNDILALQDLIAQRILNGLRLELSETEQEKLGRRPTDNPQAWEEYLRGRDNFGRFIFRTVSNEDCEAAIANFKYAIDLDPHFALAYSGLGACYANRFFKGLGEPEDYTHAESAFTKAFFYDPDVVEARVLMVLIYMARGEKRKARAEIKVLQEQFPNEAPLYFVKGTMHRLDGEYPEALKAFQKLARLDPAARVVAAYNRSRVFLYQKRFEEALNEIEKGKKLEPNHPMLRIFHAATLFHSGEHEEGIKMLEKVIEEKSMEGVRPLLAAFLAVVGRDEDSRKQLTNEALALAKSDHDMAYWVGEAYSQLGETDLAFKWLNRAVKLGNENKTFYQNDLCLAPLRDDKRFEELLNSMSPDR